MQQSRTRHREAQTPPDGIQLLSITNHRNSSQRVLAGVLRLLPGLVQPQPQHFHFRLHIDFPALCRAAAQGEANQSQQRAGSAQEQADQATQLAQQAEDQASRSQDRAGQWEMQLQQIRQQAGSCQIG